MKKVLSTGAARCRLNLFRISAVGLSLLCVGTAMTFWRYQVDAQVQRGEASERQKHADRRSVINRFGASVAATITEGGNVYAVGFQEDQPFKIRIFSGASNAYGLRGEWLAYSKPAESGIGDQLFLRNFQTNENLNPFPEYSVAGAEWNPATSRIAAIISRGSNFRVAIYDLNGRDVEYLDTERISPELLRWDSGGDVLSFVERDDSGMTGVIYLTEVAFPLKEFSRREISEGTLPLVTLASNVDVSNMEILVNGRVTLSEGMALEVEKISDGSIRLYLKNSNEVEEKPISVRKITGGLLLRRISPEGNLEDCLVSSISGRVYNLDDHNIDSLDITSQASAQSSQLAASETGVTGSWYLSFPLAGYNAYSRVLNSVMDHSVPSGWYSSGRDQVIKAFTGETGYRSYGYWAVSDDLYKQQSGGAFSVKGTYTGGNWGTQYLSYDGHPGIDYRAAEGTTILAPADGRLYIPTSDSINGSPSTYNTFAIDHGNGYSTWILHAQRGSIVSAGNVRRGDPVAKVGKVGTQAAHLHFEVRRNGIPVDPYGWEGGCKDPYISAINRNLWTNSGTTWDFSTAGNDQGWESINTECSSVHDGALWIDPGASDPYIRSLPLVNVSASAFNTVELNMISSAPDGRAAVYFTTDSYPNWHESMKVSFNVSNNGTWQTYNVRMDGNAYWRGSITGLRVDPSDGGRTGTSSDTVAFNLIRLKYSSNAVIGAKSEMVSPTPGSTFSSSTVTFNWNSGSGVTQYLLYVGNSPAANDIYAQNLGLNRSATINGIPTDGRTIYVRLWSNVNGGWQYSDYSYRAFSLTGTPAQMISPTPGSTFSSSTVTFSWTSGTAVSQYWLYLGYTIGGSDIFNRSMGTNRSVTVNGLPTNGRIIYARLWSYTSSGWKYYDYNFRARS